MLFNSGVFLLFFTIFFFVYWNGKSLKTQNSVILVGSYIFYGWWDWRFLSLIMASTLTDYLVGRVIQHSEDPARRKWYLGVSIAVNLGILGFFKYFNFFLDSTLQALAFLGFHAESTYTLQIILPVGISFYTFQTLSYSIDVYRRKIAATRDLLSFASYVAFFPQLVAGPIERASRLLPQITSNRTFNYEQAVAGLRLVVWGLFKKVVIADSLAPMVNETFDTQGTESSILLGVLYFSVQIYCDFSGYSDIAIGIAKMMGFELMSNFKQPYFSRNIGEFWRKWHISLSTWFRDYLYIPLGGSKRGLSKTVRNVFLTFTVSGLWHGANWTFFCWGFYHALLFVPGLVFSTNRKYADHPTVIGRTKLKLNEWGAMLITFCLVTFGWIFFRAPDLEAALEIIAAISFQVNPAYLWGLVYIGVLFGLEVIISHEQRNPFGHLKGILRKPLNMALISAVLYHHLTNPVEEFIYFQF